MKTERDDRDELGREDAEWVERMRAHYTPEPLDAARRSAFDLKLRERLERRRWSLPWVPALGAAALAGVLAWNMLPASAPQATPVAKASAANSRWEQALFYGDLSRSSLDDGAELPPEYQAIEGAFFDDV
jgi:hypothetical protein